MGPLAWLGPSAAGSSLLGGRAIGASSSRGRAGDRRRRTAAAEPGEVRPGREPDANLTDPDVILTEVGPAPTRGASAAAVVALAEAELEIAAAPELAAGVRAAVAVEAAVGASPPACPLARSASGHRRRLWPSARVPLWPSSPSRRRPRLPRSLARLSGRCPSFGPSASSLASAGPLPVSDIPSSLTTNGLFWTPGSTAVDPGTRHASVDAARADL